MKRRIQLEIEPDDDVHCGDCEMLFLRGLKARCRIWDEWVGFLDVAKAKRCDQCIAAEHAAKRGEE